MRGVIVMVMLGLTLPASAAEISRFVSSEKAFAVNSWLVPTRTGIVVIDTQFTVPAADQLLDAVKHTGRPLEAIIITHPHPDHFNGTCGLLRLTKVPVYATQATIAGVHASAEAKRAQWKPAYGADYPDSTCAPDHALGIGASWVIDGVTFEARDYGPGEALTESIVLAPALHAAFVGDLIYNRVHPWLAEGRSVQWLAQLDRLQKQIPADWTVYPGHGDSGGVSVIAAQREYIRDFRERTRAAVNTSGLTQDATQSLNEGTRRLYPGWALEMLIPINAGAVAKEFDQPARK
jgi:glyoxylase-like metal-dependent hydrolase (beta-lactamase superfamily II)